jgi:hypothetical protein
MDDDYESRREARREQERRYQADVAYEVWRSGGDTDRVDRDRVSGSFYDGDDESLAAQRELRRQRPKPQLQEFDEQQDENYG